MEILIHSLSVTLNESQNSVTNFSGVSRMNTNWENLEIPVTEFSDPE